MKRLCVARGVPVNRHGGRAVLLGRLVLLVLDRAGRTGDVGFPDGETLEAATRAGDADGHTNSRGFLAERFRDGFGDRVNSGRPVDADGAAHAAEVVVG